jgi:CDGSH iron-sulfur domain-containing protein 3
MATPQGPQNGPYIKEEKPGRRAWCACGLSTRQPYCDGSHIGTSMTPIFVEFKEPTTVEWCGCKNTKTPPYCDGSHEKS